MTAQYTQTNNISPSNLMVDIAASVKISSSDSVDGTAFSSALDNASKNYVDKSELKTNIRRQLRIIDEQDAINRIQWYNLPMDISS